MEVKVFEVLGANDVIKKIVGTPMPSKASYRLMRISKKLFDEVKTFEDKKMDLIKKYGEEVIEQKSKCCRANTANKVHKTPDGLEHIVTECVKCKKECETTPVKKDGYFRVKEENQEIFHKEVTEILESTITVEVDLMPLEQLGDAKLSTADMAALDKFIKE